MGLQHLLGDCGGGSNNNRHRTEFKSNEGAVRNGKLMKRMVGEFSKQMEVANDRQRRRSWRQFDGR